MTLNENTGISAPRPSPMRVILWREWQESGWLLMATALSPAAFLIDPIAGRIVPGLFAIFAGAATFAAPQASRTIIFEWERPLARKLLWRMHILLPLVVLLIAAMLYLATQDRYVSQLRAGDNIIGAQEVSLVFDFVLPPLLWIVAFAGAAFTGAALDRPVTAVAAGTVVFALVAGVPLAAEDVLIRSLGMSSGSSPLNFTILAAYYVLITGMLLLLSRWLFCRNFRT